MTDDIFELKTDPNILVFGFCFKSILDGGAIAQAGFNVRY